MRTKTFREVYEEIGVSRSTAQGWATRILGKTPNEGKDNTQWYFDEEDYEKMWMIRFYKQLKYKDGNIKEILNNPNINRQECLEKQIKELIEEKNKLEDVISAACWVKETGLSPKSLRLNIGKFEDIKYDDIMSILIATSNILNLGTDKDYLSDEYFVEKEIDIRLNVFEKIMNYCDEEIDISSPKVQTQVALIPEATILSCAFLPESELAQEINADYGAGKAEYFYKAIQYYCDKNPNNELYLALENIAELGLKRYATTSNEVQIEVQKIYLLFSVLSDKGKLDLLRTLEKIYGSEASKSVIDNGANRGLSWFISRSIQIFCDNLEKDL